MDVQARRRKRLTGLKGDGALLRELDLDVRSGSTDIRKVNDQRVGTFAPPTTARRLNLADLALRSRPHDQLQLAPTILGRLGAPVADTMKAQSFLK